MALHHVGSVDLKFLSNRLVFSKSGEYVAAISLSDGTIRFFQLLPDSLRLLPLGDIQSACSHYAAQFSDIPDEEPDSSWRHAVSDIAFFGENGDMAAILMPDYALRTISLPSFGLISSHGRPGQYCGLLADPITSSLICSGAHDGLGVKASTVASLPSLETKGESWPADYRPIQLGLTDFHLSPLVGHGSSLVRTGAFGDDFLLSSRAFRCLGIPMHASYTRLGYVLIDSIDADAHFILLHSGSSLCQQSGFLFEYMDKSCYSYIRNVNSVVFNDDSVLLPLFNGGLALLEHSGADSVIVSPFHHCQILASSFCEFRSVLAISDMGGHLHLYHVDQSAPGWSQKSLARGLMGHQMNADTKECELEIAPVVGRTKTIPIPL